MTRTRRASKRMSSKNGKKSRRKLEEMSDNALTTSEDTTATTNTEMNNKSEETVEVVAEVKEAEKTERTPPAAEIEKNIEVIEMGEKLKEIDAEVKVSVEDKTPETNGTAAEEEPLEDMEMTPLVVDNNEDADTELQFDEGSDAESRKGSPVLLSRCKTRRSQSRNISTPKTLKSAVEEDGDDKESDKNTTETPDIVDTPDIMESTEVNESVIEKTIEVQKSVVIEETGEVEYNLEAAPHPTKHEPVKVPADDMNETRESFESAISTKVNVGSDFTREIDLTVPDDKDSYLASVKDLTVAETFKRMRSRRAIRSASLCRLQITKSDAMNSSNRNPTSRSTAERVPGLKRKNRSATPDGIKRFKVEDGSNHGFLSYISSPLNKFRNKFSHNEVLASTPKLTGYKKQDILEDADLSKIENDSNPMPEKKWCNIM